MKKVSLLLAAATASFMIVSGAPHIVLTEDAALTANPTIVGNSCSRSCEDTYRACTDSASKCITTYLSCQNTCKSTAEVAVPAPVLAATKDCRTCYASCYRNTACIAECVRVCAAEKPNGLSQSKPAPALGYGSVDCQSCSNSYGGCSSSCSPGDASCLGSCIDSFLGCMNQCDDSVSVSVAPATVGLSACQAACKLTADAAKALCKFKRKDRREHCEWQVAQALDVCNTACDLKVDMPAPVTPMMPRDCREACHANEYEQITACGQSGDCVHQIESAIADCDAQCDNPHEEVEASVESSSSSSSQPVGGVACVAACKLASKAASAACKFQKPSHRERCKQNVAKVETDCEAACVLIPTVKATESTEEETKAPQQHATLGAPAFTLAESEYQKHFTSFVQKHGKKYTRDEFFPRYTIFKANLNKIHAHNAKNLPYTMAVNEFADMTFTEFHAKMTGYKRMTKSDRSAAPRATNGPHTKLGRSQLASSVDWRQKNAVTPVKNQQQCGSCWAFSTTGATEGAHAIKTGNLVSLSEQQLVDCSAAQGNQGCNGGMMDQGFQYIITNGGITTEDAYPYTASQGTCQTNTTVAATLSSFVDVTPGSETALMQAVNLGPVSVAIEADQQCFQFYSGGVLSDPSCGTNLDHGVLVVGYGTDNTVSPPANYWIVKNSWGESWGENGYIRLARGSNECGIATEPSYPVV